MANTLNKILYISSSFSKINRAIDIHDYFAAVFSELAIKLQEEYPAVEIVVKIPGNTLNPANEQIQFITDAIKSNSFDCIVVSPVDIKSIYEKLNEWTSYLAQYKLLFIDQGFVSEKIDEFDFTSLEKPPYVQAKWQQGGQIAADAIINSLLVSKVSCPHIVLVEGNIGSAERITGFKKTIETNYKDKIFPTYYTIRGDYKHDTAHSEFKKYLLATIASKNHIDAIFCTNDEMALGIRLALVQLSDEYSEVSKNIDGRLPIVCGFDGIKDATILIQNDDRYLKYTIAVNLDKQVEKLVDIITKAVVRKEKPKKNSNDYYSEIECTLFQIQKSTK